MTIGPRLRFSGALWVRCALGVAFASGPGSALAQDGEGTTAVAQATAKFDEGRRFLDQGQFEKACRLFEESQTLDPSPGTLLNLGNCREQQRKWVSALAAFEQALDLAKRETDGARRDAFSNAARTRIALLTPHVATLLLRPSPTPGTVTRLNGQPISAGGVPLRLEPGAYRMEASAPGYQPYVQDLKLEGAQRLELPVPLLLPEEPQPAVEAAAPTGAVEAAAPTGVAEGLGRDAAMTRVGSSPLDPHADAVATQFGIAPYLVMGGGVILVGTGIAIGQMAASKESTLDQQCGSAPAPGEPRPCPGLGSTLDSAGSLGLAADVLWITGAVVAGVGITLFVLDSGAGGPESPSLSGHCTLSGCAVSGTF